MAQRIFTQTFCVVGAILEKDGKFLLVQENINTADNRKWNQPAGWVDPGEDPVAAVVREVKEETGFDFEPTGLIGIYSLVRKDIEKDDVFPHAIKLIFRGKIVGGEQIGPNEEISDIRWFTKAEIDAMDNRTLRDIDIQKEVSDHLSKRPVSLDIINHTISKK